MMTWIDINKKSGKYLGANFPHDSDYVDVSSYPTISYGNENHALHWKFLLNHKQMFNDPLVLYYCKNQLLYFKDEKDLMLVKMKYGF